MNIKTNNHAVIFGLPETALAVGRSLSKHKIKVHGISYSKEIGYYSKHIKAHIFSNPIKEEAKFITEIKELCNKFNEKPVLFITSDVYLKFYTENSSFIHKFFLSTLSCAKLISSIQDKYSQYNLVKNAGIEAPKTIFINKLSNINESISKLKFPVFIKARNVNIWREKISSTKKGFVINDQESLIENLNLFTKKEVPVIVQEIVQSNDNENYKVCIFRTEQGKFKLIFTLRKIHQKPIHFGIATSTESVKYPELAELGKKLFSAIDYTGVGSAEFKYDNRDKKLKLIEINTRYWQQNALADFCSMNFPLIDYMEATAQNPKPINYFQEGYKYVNIYSDFLAFKEYKAKGEMTFKQWKNDLKGKKIISFLYRDDPKVVYNFLKRILFRFAKSITKINIY